jgi:RND superfamily putative drug exporter
MFSVLGRFAANHPLRICGLWLLAGIVVSWFAPAWESTTQDDDVHFLPPHYASVRGYELLKQAFPRDVFASRALFAFERTDRKLDDSDLQLMDRCVADLKRLRGDRPDLPIGDILCCRNGPIGSRLTSADGRCTLIQVSFAAPFQAQQTRKAVEEAERVVRVEVAAAGSGAPVMLTTGAAAIGRDLLKASVASLDGTTTATVALIVIVLLLVYRAPLLASVPLITIGASVWIALKILALLALIPGTYLAGISRVFAIVILFGTGTDYCLFLISRYCEELGTGRPIADAVRRSLTGVGGALLAGSGTVVCGLGLMGFAEFAKVRCAGPAIALGLVVTVLASLTLAPALLRLLGPAAFWPRTSSGEPTSLDRGLTQLWEWVSRQVMTRPMLVWGLAAIALLPLAILGLRVAPIHRSTAQLPASARSMRGLAAIARHFPAGEIGPITLLLAGDQPWDGKPGRQFIERLSQELVHLPNIVEVRSLTQPLGKPLPPIADGRMSGLLRLVGRNRLDKAMEEVRKAALGFYIGERTDEASRRFVTRLDVVPASDPFGPDSFRTLELMRSWIAKQLPDAGFGVESESYGITVNAADLAKVTEGDRQRVNMLVVIAVFIILLALVRNAWLAAYLLLTVFLSYSVTLGATALVNRLWSHAPELEVDWRVPFFLFSILVAVAADYNILLLTRVLKERKRHGVREGTRRALARTGGTICSCGLIMAGTFSTLMLAPLSTLQQIGFALAFGVLLDTFIVRPFLVPVFIMLVWGRNCSDATDPILADEPDTLEKVRGLEEALDPVGDVPFATFSRMPEHRVRPIRLSERFQLFFRKS